MRQVYK